MKFCVDDVKMSAVVCWLWKDHQMEICKKITIFFRFSKIQTNPKTDRTAARPGYESISKNTHFAKVKYLKEYIINDEKV